MAVDLYERSYERAGLDVIKKSLTRLLHGKLSEYGAESDYTDLEKKFARALSPHFAELYADMWNASEMEPHNIDDAQAGQLAGYQRATALADFFTINIHASDMDFTIQHIPEGQTDMSVALDFAEMFEKLKGDFCEIIRMTSQEQQDAMRKFTPNAPKLDMDSQPKPKAPKGPKSPYEIESDPYA